MSSLHISVDCAMEANDGGMASVSSDKMVFELNQGEYELSGTSLSGDVEETLESI